ncbi:hypothetical protein KUTeg_020214 [Tegillarca granosa]|uniref:Transgelin n=1 Tax=Tegillarca granosa TaxID=220873 RepID=A0ABQ9ECE5_TEGGR|nr:hypothetical protein KUTeg_020214 [Tegillarca granosa]
MTAYRTVTVKVDKIPFSSGIQEMANRPRGYGLTSEITRKIQGKYDHHLEQEAREWIENLLSRKLGDSDDPLGPNGLQQVLKDGSILCQYDLNINHLYNLTKYKSAGTFCNIKEEVIIHFLNNNPVSCNHFPIITIFVIDNIYLMFYFKRVMNVLSPGSIKKVNESKMAFKMMENISQFLAAAENYGTPKTDLFQTVDLFEGQNMVQVVNGIHALGRTAQKRGFTGPKLGVKEADYNPRNFDEDKLNAGQTVIGLQMGTNRGASQAGMNFGKARSIMD